jgi:pimeloyl-ACP methyl ester carboxylesterase
VIGATRHPAVKALAYIAAMAPDEGEAVAAPYQYNPAHPMAPKLEPDGHGLVWLTREAFSTAFAQNASAEEQVVLHAVQRPISAACITVPVGRPLWRDVPAWYLVAKQDRMIVEPTQRLMAARMNARVHEHDVDHTPSVTAPETVIELILQALQSASA